jgi:hypothetical protein
LIQAILNEIQHFHSFYTNRINIVVKLEISSAGGGFVCQIVNQLHGGVQTADHMYSAGCTLYSSNKCTLPLPVYKLKTSLEKKKQIISKHLTTWQSSGKVRKFLKYL